MDDFDFETPRRGWLVLNDCPAADAYLYSTTDGGRSWNRSVIDARSCNAGATHVIDFVDRTTGWLENIEPTSGGPPNLLHTTTGGRKWSGIDEPPMGRIGFRTRRQGFLVDYMWGSGFYATTDGGETWSRKRVKKPPRYRHRPIHALPTFSQRVGILPVTLLHKKRADVAFYMSHDGGKTWHRRTLLRTRVPACRSCFMGPLPSSIVDKKIWWVLSARGPRVYITTDGGRSWIKRRVDLPTPSSISAIDAQVAWATVYRRNRSFLYRTRDGGRTWHRLNPGR